MTWYTAHYKNSNEKYAITTLEGTSNRKEIFKKAQEVANEKKVEVTIIANRGSGMGEFLKFYKVKPQ